MFCLYLIVVIHFFCVSVCVCLKRFLLHSWKRLYIKHIRVKSIMIRWMPKDLPSSFRLEHQPYLGDFLFPLFTRSPDSPVQRQPLCCILCWSSLLLSLKMAPSTYVSLSRFWLACLRAFSNAILLHVVFCTTLQAQPCLCSHVSASSTIRQALRAEFILFPSFLFFLMMKKWEF